MNDRELIGMTNRTPSLYDTRCTWGDDAWHRAVTRLTLICPDGFRRLLAEERAKSGCEQP